jgi:hypothetical protein
MHLLASNVKNKIMVVWSRTPATEILRWPLPFVDVADRTAPHPETEERLQQTDVPTTVHDEALTRQRNRTRGRE